MQLAVCWLFVECLLCVFFSHQLRLIVVEFFLFFVLIWGIVIIFRLPGCPWFLFFFVVHLFSFFNWLLLLFVCKINCDFFLTKLFLCFILFLLALQLLPVVKTLLESCQRLLWRCSESLEIIWVARWRLFFFSWCQVIDCGPVIKTLLESHWRSLQRCSKLPEIVQVVGWRMFIFSWCQVINGGHPQSLIRHYWVVGGHSRGALSRRRSSKLWLPHWRLPRVSCWRLPWVRQRLLHITGELATGA